MLLGNLILRSHDHSAIRGMDDGNLCCLTLIEEMKAFLRTETKLVA